MLRRMLSLAIVVALAGTAPAADKAAKPFEVKDLKVRLSGPYTHQNLTVFLLHAPDQDKRDYLTLVEGLDKKLVKLTEQEREQVGELMIENTSNRHLFLQEGDRLQGGKQDRIIITSLVVPPKSGKMKVPSFCIESGRWQLGAAGRVFDNTSNTVQSPQAVRAAAKLTPDKGGQPRVWDEVADKKAKAMTILGAKNTNTSLNEALDSAEVKKVCEAVGKALNDVAGKHADAVGMAVAVNGRIEEVNLYPNHALFVQVYPRLVQAFGIQAALEKDKKPGTVKEADVEAFMKGGKEKAQRFEGIDKDNRIRVRDLEKQFECVTDYKGEAVHRQWINRAALPESRDKK
jgi:ARG and Rhodanese-Phosphatase-superfamily-associated Protein domain